MLATTEERMRGRNQPALALFNKLLQTAQQPALPQSAALLIRLCARS
jgi:hypothetical protein